MGVPYKLSTTGKIFIASVAGWLLGRTTNLKVRGSKQEVEKLAAALVNSRKFQEELAKPGATAETVIAKLGLKNASVEDFERITGIPWPG
jgi:hypothetical protein